MNEGARFLVLVFSVQHPGDYFICQLASLILITIPRLNRYLVTQLLFF